MISETPEPETTRLLETRAIVSRRLGYWETVLVAIGTVDSARSSALDLRAQ